MKKKKKNRYDWKDHVFFPYNMSSLERVRDWTNLSRRIRERKIKYIIRHSFDEVKHCSALKMQQWWKMCEVYKCVNVINLAINEQATIALCGHSTSEETWTICMCIYPQWKIGGHVILWIEMRSTRIASRNREKRMKYLFEGLRSKKKDICIKLERINVNIFHWAMGKRWYMLEGSSIQKRNWWEYLVVWCTWRGGGRFLCLRRTLWTRQPLEVACCLQSLDQSRFCYEPLCSAKS